MKKKIIYTLSVLLVLFIGVLIASPYVLEAKIGDIIKNYVNNRVNATLDLTDAKLSLVNSFPNAEISLKGVSLKNKAPFEGDILFAAQNVDLKIGIFQLFKNEDKRITIQHLLVNEANLNLTTDIEGNTSYDIGKASSQNESASSDSSSGFKLYVELYEIINSNISYVDKIGGLSFSLSSLQHKGSGDLSLENSKLDTTTEALVSFEKDSTNYLDKNSVKLDALIGVDLKENKYSFLKNEILINQLPLVFDGYVKLHDDNQEIDFNLKTSSSDFKNFLNLIPQTYSKNINDVTTTGNFVLQGKFNGVVDDNHIPKFNVNINSDNASFKYSDLPKAVRNVFIDVVIANTTGISEDTFVNINKLSFMIDEDTFNIDSKITKLTGNTKVNAHIDGILNLANIEKAYPVPTDMDLKGVLNTDITTTFDMASIEQKRYEDTNSSGNLSLTDFEYKSAEMQNSIKLDSTSFTFNPKTVTLNQLKGSTGKTDFNAIGTINNLLGFMFNDEKVKGDFNLKSNAFVLNDFMTVTKKTKGYEGGQTFLEAGASTSDEKIKIPSFLDANINVVANAVLYDDLLLKDVKGNLKIIDEKAILSNMTTSIFDGNIAFDGEVSTENDVPTFAMKLGMDKLQITETFKSLELFKVLAPIAQVLKGNFDSNIELSGNLNDDFTPNIGSLSGDIFAKVLTNHVDTKKAPLLSALDDKLGLLWIKKLNIDSLKTKLSFEDGVVSVKPFEIKYEDIAIVIDGSHTFDKKLNYKATMNLPSKYLGSKVNKLIAIIDNNELKDLTMPVIASIGGDYASPKFSTDLSSGIKKLTSKLVEIQKQKLINQGKNKTRNLLNDILGKTKSEKDSTQKSGTTKEAVSGVIGSVLGGDKKNSTQNKTDSVPAKKKEDLVKDAAKDILGGFLGKKKK